VYLWCTCSVLDIYGINNKKKVIAMPKVARKATETLNRPACLVRLYHLWQAERGQGHELPPDEQGIEPHTLSDADLVALGKRVAARVKARQQQVAPASPAPRVDGEELFPDDDPNPDQEGNALTVPTLASNAAATPTLASNAAATPALAGNAAATQQINRPGCIARLHELWQQEHGLGVASPAGEMTINLVALPDAALVALGKRVAARVKARQQQAAPATPGQERSLPAAPYRVQQVNFPSGLVYYRVVLPDSTGLPWTDDLLLARATYGTWLQETGAPVPELPPDIGQPAPRGSSLLDDMARARVRGLRSAGLLAFGEGNAGSFYHYAILEGPFESEDAERQWAADDPTRIKALELSSPGDLVIRERDGGYYYDAIVAGPFESEDAAQQWAADTERGAPVLHSGKKSNGWGRHILSADDKRLVLMQRIAALQRKQGLPVSYPLELGNVSNEELAQCIASLEGQGERDEHAAAQQQVMEGLA
jgi:hypothetical protein